MRNKILEDMLLDKEKRQRVLSRAATTFDKSLMPLVEAIKAAHEEDPDFNDLVTIHKHLRKICPERATELIVVCMDCIIEKQKEDF